MRYHDITHTLNGEVPIWPGDPLFSLEQIQTIGQESDSNLHQLTMGIHTGTHVDAPYHFLSNGKRLGEMDLSHFIGDCLVLDCPCATGGPYGQYSQWDTAPSAEDPQQPPSLSRAI